MYDMYDGVNTPSIMANDYKGAIESIFYIMVSCRAILNFFRASMVK